jgi:cyclopropane fatty-acyl-phospholipid synthase-like methyltransferase
MQTIKTRQLVELLTRQLPETSLLNKLKISYRPYICPFDILLLYHIPKNASVFDIGCGSGMFLMLVAEFCSPEKLAGVEIHQTLIDNATQLLSQYQKPVRLSTYDGKIIPDWISDYNCITMIDVLHHIPPKEQEAFLEQLYNKMHKGATFIFKDIDADALPWVYFNKMHDFVLSQEIGSEWKAQRFLDYAQKLGFKVLHFSTQRTIVYPHFTVILSAN